jgi:hypothetical protein
MANIPQKCPSCAAPLAVTQLTCTACSTGVVGHFELSPFFQLSASSLQFLETFIKNRGNVKEIERETGESYWAIRRQLDEVIVEMGLGAQPEVPPANQRQEILERLGRSEITAQEAAQLLMQLSKK